MRHSGKSIRRDLKGKLVIRVSRNGLTEATRLRLTLVLPTGEVAAEWDYAPGTTDLEFELRDVSLGAVVCFE